MEKPVSMNQAKNHPIGSQHFFVHRNDSRWAYLVLSVAASWIKVDSSPHEKAFGLNGKNTWLVTFSRVGILGPRVGRKSGCFHLPNTGCSILRSKHR